MMEYLFVAGIIAVAVLFGLKFFLKLKVLPVLLMGVIIISGINPAVYSVGKNIYQNETSRFNEYWNGFETAAYKKDVTCVRDGSCVHTYDCDPYKVLVTKTRTVSDGKGGTTTETYTEWETRYHQCPYSTQETSYYVDSTIDTFTIAKSLMTGDQYRAGRSIPGGKQTDPVAWLEAKDRVESNQPGPVTAVKNYKNFILASQDEFYAKYSDQIDTLKEKGLIRPPAQGVHSVYYADKAYNFGSKLAPDAFIKLKNDVAYLNGAVGGELQGDLHVVFTSADVEVGKDDYLNTLMAYWQSEEMERNAISKNAIVVVMGISADGKTVEWAKAETGMPVGNEGMAVAIASAFKDVPVDDKLIGRPSYDIGSGAVKHSEGMLETILWGDNGFERVSMSSNDEDDNGTGYDYLLAGINPEGWALFFIGFVNFILAAGMVTLVTWLILSRKIPSDLIHWKKTGYYYN